jgi:hypothetical protein
VRRPREARTPPRDKPDERVPISALLCRVAWQMLCLFNTPKPPGGGEWCFPMKLPAGVMSPEDWKSLYEFARKDDQGFVYVTKKMREDLKSAVYKAKGGYVSPAMQESHVAPLVELWANMFKSVNGDYGEAFLKGVTDRLVAAGEASGPRDTPGGLRQRPQAGAGAGPSRPRGLQF